MSDHTVAQDRPPSTVPEALEAAARLIERGHCKGAAARDADGGEVYLTSATACSWSAEGAIRMACAYCNWPGALSATDMVLFELADHLRILHGIAENRRYRILWDWNDAPERTAAEVAAEMRACAEAFVP